MYTPPNMRKGTVTQLGFGSLPIYNFGKDSAAKSIIKENQHQYVAHFLFIPTG
jgi:hypothetical protein